MIKKYPGPEVIIFFSCSTQLNMRFFLLINVKMPTIFVVRLVADHPHLRLKFTIRDFLIGIGDVNERFILDFHGS